jgi:hypothetical protein
VPRPEVVVVAHRGMAAGYPENTLAAFRHSVAPRFPTDHPVRAADEGQHQPRQPLPHVYSPASTMTGTFAGWIRACGWIRGLGLNGSSQHRCHSAQKSPGSPDPPDFPPCLTANIRTGHPANTARACNPARNHSSSPPRHQRHHHRCAELLRTCSQQSSRGDVQIPPHQLGQGAMEAATAARKSPTTITRRTPGGRRTVRQNPWAGRC